MLGYVAYTARKNKTKTLRHEAMHIAYIRLGLLVNQAKGGSSQYVSDI